MREGVVPIRTSLLRARATDRGPIWPYKPSFAGLSGPRRMDDQLVAESHDAPHAVNGHLTRRTRSGKSRRA